MPTRTAKPRGPERSRKVPGRWRWPAQGSARTRCRCPSERPTAGGTTSPEELIAAAHSACYAMSLSNEVGQAGGTPRTLDVKADVSLGPDPAGGFRLTGIALTVSGDVDGLDAAGFEAAAEAAKVGCPVSKALTGVDITMNVTT